MREIKFRGKVKYNGNHKFNGEWIYGYYGDNDNGNASITQTLDEMDKETIGQYTGLKDKNGKEIYEGDIIKCSFYPEYMFEIKFTELCWYMRKITTSEHIKLSDALYYELEVIGNIHDNPDLLEVKDE